MANEPAPTPQRTLSAARTGWRGLGAIGRAAIVGLILSAVVAVVLGFFIPAAVRTSLLNGELDVLARTIISEPESDTVAAMLQGEENVLDDVEHLVDHRLLGGRTVRVKIIDATGTIIYSDERSLIGRQFPLSAEARSVFRGTPSAIALDPADPENAAEAAMGDLYEFILPVTSSSGEVLGLFEVYQPVDSLSQEVRHLKHVIWTAIGTGLGLAAVFTASLTLASGRAALRRHRQSERLLEELLHAEAEERRRVVGALHNDVGQPLFRILHGLQATRLHLGEDHSEEEELRRLEDLARGIDKTLRAEFNALYRPISEDTTLVEAIESLARAIENDSGLQIITDCKHPGTLTPATREALYRATEESLANARKHSHAGSVWVKLDCDDHRLTLTVEDDGVGATGAEGMGLLTTRERLEAIGGGLRMRSRPTVGTLVTAWVPFEGEEER